MAVVDVRRLGRRAARHEYRAIEVIGPEVELHHHVLSPRSVATQVAWSPPRTGTKGLCHPLRKSCFLTMQAALVVSGGLPIGSVNVRVVGRDL